jgi:hypothetical protein
MGCQGKVDGKKIVMGKERRSKNKKVEEKVETCSICKPRHLSVSPLNSYVCPASQPAELENDKISIVLVRSRFPISLFHFSFTPSITFSPNGEKESWHSLG